MTGSTNGNVASEVETRLVCFELARQFSVDLTCFGLPSLSTENSYLALVVNSTQFVFLPSV